MGEPKSFEWTEERSKQELDRMRRHIATGSKVIAALERLPPGYSTQDMNGLIIHSYFAGAAIRIKRRATREEYLKYCPPEDLPKAQQKFPYYFELEIVEQQ